MKKLLTTLCAIGLFAVAGSASAATYYVRSSGNDTNCNGTVNIGDFEPSRPNCAEATLTAALGDAAASGDTIEISLAGTYDSGATYYQVTKSVTISNTSGGVVTLTSSHGSYVMNVSGTINVTLNGLSLIDSVDTGIIDDRATGTLTINGGAITNTHASGGLAYFGGASDLTGRHFITDGTALTFGGRLFITNASATGDIKVRNGSITWSDAGAQYGWRMSQKNLRNVEIVNNTINWVPLDNGSARSFFLSIGSDTGTGTTFRFEDNTVTSSGAQNDAAYILQIQSGTRPVIRNNRFYSTLTGNAMAIQLGIDGADSASALGATNPVNGLVEGNIVYSTGVNNTHGILIGSGADYTKVTNNIVDGADYAFVLKATGLMVNNNVCLSGNAESCLYLRGATGNVVEHNSGYLPNASAGMVHFENQTLGSANPARDACYNKVYDNVLSAAAGYMVQDNLSAACGNLVDRNVYYYTGTAKAGYLTWQTGHVTVDTLADLNSGSYGWTTLTGYDRLNDANSVQSNPQFVDSNYRVSSFSPAKGTKNLSSPNLSQWNDKGAWQTTGGSNGASRSPASRSTNRN